MAQPDQPAPDEMCFEGWFHGQEGYALRSERIADTFPTVDFGGLREWLQAAFDGGQAAADTRLRTEHAAMRKALETIAKSDADGWTLGERHADCAQLARDALASLKDTPPND